MRDPYLYEDADVLINLGNIKDVELLKSAEADVTGYTLAILYNTEFKKFDSQALLDAHRIIFGDLYPWAGEIRTIQMTKPEQVLGGDTVRYSHPKEIKNELAAVLKETTTLNQAQDRNDLIFRIVRITAKLWQIHPFREGNTRAIVAFSILLAQHHGIEVNSLLFEKHAAYVRNALVWASQGIYAKFEYLERIYFDAMNGDLSHSSGDDLGSEKYTIVNGHYIADQIEQPHTYGGDES
jgi:cell filamentation protein